MHAMGPIQLLVIAVVVLVLFGNKESEDLHYGFYQDTNFYYLTGWEEPGGILILTPETDKDDPAFSMKALGKTLHSSLASSFDATLAQPAGSGQPSGGPSAETMAQLQALLGPGKQLPHFPPAQDPPA